MEKARSRAGRLGEGGKGREKTRKDSGPLGFREYNSL